MAMAVTADSARLTSFLSALDGLRLATIRATARAVTDGGTGAEAAPWPAVWENDADAMKAKMPGSILFMKDGTVMMTTVSRGLVRNAAASTFSLSVLDGKGKTVREQGERWLSDKVEAVALGVLTVEDKPGPRAALLKVGGLATALTLLPDPAVEDATDFTHMRVAVAGAATNDAKVDKALCERLGVPVQPWGGGPRASVLRAGGGLTTEKNFKQNGILYG